MSYSCCVALCPSDPRRAAVCGADQEGRRTAAMSNVTFLPCDLSPCGTRCGKKPRHDFAGQPVSGIETWRGTESGEPVGAADPLGSREAAAKPVTDDRPHLF